MKQYLTMTEEQLLSEENLRRLFRVRSTFFKMPRGNPGQPGSVAHRMWHETATRVREAQRRFNNGHLSFRDAVREAFHAQLALEQFRNEHGSRAPRERRSLLLTGMPVELDEPEDTDVPTGCFLLTLERA